MSKFVIGDLHGCFSTLKNAIEKLNIDFNNDKVIFLGDYIDRGTHPIKTLLYVKDLTERYPDNVIALKGNHEDMFYNYTYSNDDVWLSNGHRTTVMELYDLSEEEQDEILNWIESLPLRYEDEDYRYCHSGNFNEGLDGYGYDLSLWDRDWMNYESSSDKPVIFGHTPFNNYQIINGNFGIDTGAVFGNGLTIMETTSIGDIHIHRIPTVVTDEVR